LGVGRLDADEDVLAVPPLGLEHHLRAFLERLEAVLQLLVLGAEDARVSGHEVIAVLAVLRDGDGQLVGVDLLYLPLLEAGGLREGLPGEQEKQESRVASHDVCLVRSSSRVCGAGRKLRGRPCGLRPAPRTLRAVRRTPPFTCRGGW